MMTKRFCLLFVLSGAMLVCGFSTSWAEPAGTPLEVKAPLGLPAVPIPQDNPMTVEKVELGKMLYFDKRLSKDETISCATCHDPNHAYAEDRPTSEGIFQQVGGRNANSVINTAYFTELFWDGRAKSLEEQAGGPVENPIEMGAKMELVIKKIADVPEYKKRFKDVFGTDVTRDGIVKAIAAFERTILSGNSPYDKYMNGDKSAMSEDAVKGMALFQGPKMCAVCHSGPTFSNGAYFNSGAGKGKGLEDGGLMEVTKKETDKGKFRVPMLRDAAKTGPYMHDGSIPTLREAVAFMASGGKANPNLFPVFRSMQKPTEEEIDQLTAFVEALSGEYPIIEPPELP